MFSDLDNYLFKKGVHYELYEKLGAHPAEEGFHVAVWAPHAEEVSLLYDGNGWNPDADKLPRTEGTDVFEADIPGAREGQCYKFQIKTRDGRYLKKADPFAFRAELRPGTASRFFTPRYAFTDEEWISRRAASSPLHAPISIYECHPASWMRHWEAKDDGFYSFSELADRLVKYVKDMGYTHIELIGLAEYPLDASWGYQVTGYYAPTARLGSPDDFRYFVDTCHKNGIGVIMDWVPAHFPRDDFALADFDGEPLFEHPDPRLGEHPDWGTKIFNYGYPAVSNFLIANALFWIREYHLDGLRVDAVASMLYLDYGRKDGEWVANRYGGNQNLEAIEFFRHLNSVIRENYPGVMTIAEESTAWPKITGAPEDGGLGFTFKWNMGWMHDFLDYMKQDPLFRSFHHNEMTFAMTYADSENFILAISHDEVVHLKCSMWEKMPGYEIDKYKNLKCAYTFMFGHPGKKLLFMGQEFGQRREWCEDRELDWFMLQDKRNSELQQFFRDLLHLYRRNPSLWQEDRGFAGFEWMGVDDRDRSIFSFARFGHDRRHPLIFTVNFTPVARDDYRLGLPAGGHYELVLNETHGLIHVKDRPVYTAENIPADNHDHSIAYPLPAYGIAIFRRK